MAPRSYIPKQPKSSSPGFGSVPKVPSLKVPPLTHVSKKALSTVPKRSTKKQGF